MSCDVTTDTHEGNNQGFCKECDEYVCTDCAQWSFCCPGCGVSYKCVDCGGEPGVEA